MIESCQVVITDFPDPALVKNLEKNVDMNIDAIRVNDPIARESIAATRAAASLVPPALARTPVCLRLSLTIPPSPSPCHFLGPTAPVTRTPGKNHLRGSRGVHLPPTCSTS